MSDKKINVILAGPPGDMGTRILKVIEDTPNVELCTFEGFDVALTGFEIKKEKIDDDYKESYHKKSLITLATPDQHDDILNSLRKDYDCLIGINFATVEGYDTNFKFIEHEIPFISGVTGALKERESELEKAVKVSTICSVIDKNMSPALVVVGAMLNYAADTFPGALEGYVGYGIDSHQKTKKDDISGTLVKWEKPIKKLGVNFVPAKGDRTGEYGHGDHFIRIASPDGTVKITLQTEVLGRDTYAHATVEKALPFIVEQMKKGNKGKVYGMADVLKGK